MHNLCKLIKLITEISQGFFFPLVNKSPLPPRFFKASPSLLAFTTNFLHGAASNYLKKRKKETSVDCFLFRALGSNLQNTRRTGQRRAAGAPEEETVNTAPGTAQQIFLPRTLPQTSLMVKSE